jgi:hypothetical protein
MNLCKLLCVSNRQEWRLWLSKNYDKEKEIWLVYPKKASGKTRIIIMTQLKKHYVLGG